VVAVLDDLREANIFDPDQARFVVPWLITVFLWQYRFTAGVNIPTFSIWIFSKLICVADPPDTKILLTLEKLRGLLTLRCPPSVFLSFS